MPDTKNQDTKNIKMDKRKEKLKCRPLNEKFYPNPNYNPMEVVNAYDLSINILSKSPHIYYKKCRLDWVVLYECIKRIYYIDEGNDNLRQDVMDLVDRVENLY